MTSFFKRLLFLCGATGACMSLAAQTNPTAVSLPFSLNSQSSASLPAGIAVHRFTSIPTTRTLSPATGDLPAEGSSPTSVTGGWYYLGSNGIGLLSSGTNPAGAVLLAINTTGQSNIQVSWLCRTILNQASRDNSIALQYRIGTSGNFTNAGTSTTYSSTGTTNGSSSGTFTETLPPAAENQAVVQLRWIYWESNSTSGSRDKIAVDDISVSAVSSGSCAAPAGLAAGSITDSGAGLTWSSLPGAGYEYVLNTTAAAPLSGTALSDTFYTATGLSAATTYYFHLRSDCGDSNYSAWITDSFTTASVTDAAFTVMTYNLLNYPGSTASQREPDYRVVMAEAQPDILVVQELSSPTGLNSFLSNVLNYGGGSSYSAGTLIDGPDSDNGIFYKSSLFQFISNTPIHTDLRDISRFSLKHIPSGDTLIIYSAHLKSSNTAADEAQRAVETDDLRAVTDNTDAGKYFMVCGDFNIYGSSETAYQNLVQNGANTNGKFFDIVPVSGTWNNAAYAAYHTQSPRTTSFGGGATGGMDDRFDMFLFSGPIIQNEGFDIVSGSYKAFGNDGQHYNQALNTPPYLMYDSTLAAALHDASDHIPVVVKLEHHATEERTAISRTTLPVLQDDLLTLYPNPLRGILTVQVNLDYTAPLHLGLYTIGGKPVTQLTFTGGAAGERQTIDLGYLPAGVYYLQSKELNLTRKIIKY